MLNGITLILGIIFTIYYFYLKIVFGGISFSEIFLVVGIILIIYQIFKKKSKKRRFLRVLKIIISVFLIVFVVTESLIIFLS